MTFRIAVVQPIANPIGEDEKNIADAVDFIARAAAEGADFVCFPETYPGPWRMPATLRSDAAAGGSRRQARHQRGLRHHRAAQPQRGHRA